MTVRLIDLPLREVHPMLRALSDAGFDSELAEFVRKRGGGERAVAALQREFFPVDVVATDQPAPVVLTTYKVTVDYRMTLEQMIAAGQYNSRNNDITAECFPLSGTGQVEVELHLVHLGHNASTDTVLAEMDRRNFRPGKIEECLALGVKYPDLQKQFPVVALGSVWCHPGGDRCVAYLDGWEDGGREFGLLWYGHAWPEHYRFLAVSK